MKYSTAGVDDIRSSERIKRMVLIGRNGIFVIHKKQLYSKSISLLIDTFLLTSWGSSSCLKESKMETDKKMVHNNPQDGIYMGDLANEKV